ncbi:MAG: chromosomal replication initiator protein DnaA [Candidatus Heteroscillospira sp.]
MNSLTEIWESVVAQLSASLTPTAMNTWFSEVTPVALDNNKLVIHTLTDFKRNIIVQRFADTIKNCLSELFACPFELVVLAGDEITDYKTELEVDTGLPEIAGYTFDNFIVGPSNKFAHAASKAVADHPGSIYNPLFIYGNSGLGKTHLLLAIGQAIHARDLNAKMAYLKGDDFTVQMIRSIREGTQEEFRQKYRYVDLLLMDDIQFISGKMGVQEEFFHTFNCLYEAGKQIVITSDRPPIEMLKLADRLRSRFEAGLIADVQQPNMETRAAITRNKAMQLGMLLPDEVINYIAENITANVRQIEGVVKRLTAYKEILDDNITIDSVKRAIKDVIRVGTYIPTPDVIIAETARYYSIDPNELRGQRRSKNTAMARQVSMYLMRSLTNLALTNIGEEFEGRNHSTVLSSIRKVEDLLKTDPDMSSTIRDITSNINSRN